MTIHSELESEPEQKCVSGAGVGTEAVQNVPRIPVGMRSCVSAQLMMIAMPSGGHGPVCQPTEPQDSRLLIRQWRRRRVGVERSVRGSE